MTTINYNNLTELARQVHADNVKKGFYDIANELLNNEEAIFKNDEQYFFVRNAILNQLLTLITTEVSEACEAIRKERFCVSEGVPIANFCQLYEAQPEEAYAYAYKMHVKDSFEAELAGAIIRLLDLAGFYNVDIEQHVQAELRYNRTREHKHGKSC